MRNEIYEKRQTLHFRDLLIWQRAMRLTKRLYQLTAGFPTAEKDGLAAQMRRAAASVPSNVILGGLQVQPAPGRRAGTTRVAVTMGPRLETARLIGIYLVQGRHRGQPSKSAVSRCAAVL
jgi:hypothetical protein